MIFKNKNIGLLGAAAIAGLVVGIGFAGCQAEDPHLNYFDSQAWPDAIFVADQPGTCPKTPTLSAPSLSTYSNPTSNELQPFRGTASGASKILCRGGAGDYSSNVGTDGKFCIECRLYKDSTNKITFVPVDSNGCWGKETTISIAHKTSTTSDAGVTSVSNIALGQTVTNDNTLSAGDLSYVVDDDTSTSASLSFWDLELGSTLNAYTYLKVDLGKTYTVSKLKIRYPSNVGSDYATGYSILLSSSTSPVDPDPTKTSDWTIPTTSSSLPEEAGTSATQEIDIAPQNARWAALLLYENGAWGWTESFQIAEFEVWGVDPNATPPTPTDRCK
jgi:hypothetical protein